MAVITAKKASLRVSEFVNNTSVNAIKHNAENKAIASHASIFPDVSGLFFVRSTFESYFLSAKSLITQPALRMTITPAIKIKRSLTLGNPCAAIHNAHNVGHNNNKMPTGLFKRIN